MDVSIIIVNYNTKDLLVNCIDSIYLQTNNFQFEIIVVDNASEDGSQQILKKQYPNIQLIESERVKDKIRDFEQDMWNY